MIFCCLFCDVSTSIWETLDDHMLRDHRGEEFPEIEEEFSIEFTAE